MSTPRDVLELAEEDGGVSRTYNFTPPDIYTGEATRLPLLLRGGMLSSLPTCSFAWGVRGIGGKILARRGGDKGIAWSTGRVASLRREAPPYEIII